MQDLFSVLKRANTKEISQDRFTEGLGQKVPALTSKDLVDLFRAIDVDRSNSLSLAEIQAEFADIEVALVLRDIKESGFDYKKLFASVDTSDKGKLDVLEFAQLINLSSKSCSKSEIDFLFRVVDK